MNGSARGADKPTADSRALAFEVADMLKATVGGPAYIEAYQRARDELAEARMERKRKRAFEVRSDPRAWPGARELGRRY